MGRAGSGLAGHCGTGDFGSDRDSIFSGSKFGIDRDFGRRLQKNLRRR